MCGGDDRFDLQSDYYKSREEILAKSFRWGKWEEEAFEFAGCSLRQGKDMSIVLNQEAYSLKWLEEINIDKNKARKTSLNPQVISQLRGAGSRDAARCWAGFVVPVLLECEEGGGPGRGDMG